MSLRQQIITDRIEEIASILKLPNNDAAFLRLSHSIITGQSIHAFDDPDLVDGGQDKQIDTITIEDRDGDEATVYIIQAKNTDSFSSNALIQMRNGLNWIFNKPKSDLQELTNTKFRDKILEYRSIQSGFGPSNIHIVVAFVTNGLSKTISDEFKQEAKSIRNEYDNNTFQVFDLLICGADELVDRINITEKKNRKVNADIKIRYDANNPSLVKYHSEGLKGIICSASGREIARIVNDDKAGYVFDSNIRRFLGGRGAVNADIRTTCTKSDSSHLFWFLNNGITIACDSFDPVTDPDNPHIKIRNIQIVNGCQTATTLAQAATDKILEPNVFVLLRIYETPDNSLVDRIVLTTNNQNKISSRDLRANDRVQIEMQQRFDKFKLHYERKVREFDNNSSIDSSRIAPNELVAQSYLAIVMKKPSDARRRKYKVWGDHYDRIFTVVSVEPYVISFLLYRNASQWLKTSGKTIAHDDFTRRLANNGAFHVARIAAYEWRGSDNWEQYDEELPKQIETLEDKQQDMSQYLVKAFDALKNIIDTKSEYRNDLDRAMKSYDLDADIDKYLHSHKRA
ncbi:MAG: AIPR family protein [Phycisphaeraceae bacterium]|nr:AIPR family protein [Phycisphaeraceae bacterium]